MATTTDTRQIILASAIATFARKGYAGTSVQDILRATKLSKPTLYYYFDSKAGLFRAILDFAYDESFRRMQAAAADQASCEAKLVAVATAMFQFAERNRDLMRLVFATVFAAPEEIPPDCANPVKRRCHLEFVRDLLRTAQKNGEIDPQYDLRKLTHGVFGAISHHIRSYLLMPEGRLDGRRAKNLVALYLNGARHRN